MEGISREEHEEFRRRMEEEDKRQNRRIDLVEKSIQQIGDIAMSVEKMAVSLQSMVKEQEQQESVWKHWNPVTARCGGRPLDMPLLHCLEL